MRQSIYTLTIVGALTAASVTIAASHTDTPREVVARHGLMNVISINLGIIGDMAKGETAYDADAAKTAADSLLGVALVDQATLWPDATLGIDKSRALPAISETRAEFMAIWDEYDTAAANLQAIAGDGRDGLGAALGALGQTCKACHDDYRAPR